MQMANVSGAKYIRDNDSLQDNDMWAWNPYYGMYTFVPAGRRRLCNPFYGYCYWTPQSVYGAFYAPTSQWYGYGNNGNASGFSYPTAAQTSGGYSGTMASAPSVSSAPAASSSSTSAAAAGSSSVGHGSASGGGRGH